jgi:hypothetical protein
MKFFVTVCVPAERGADVPDAVRELLAPYDMRDQPDGRWDWYTIRGDLPVRPEYDGHPLLVHNPVWPNGEPRAREPLRCDGGPVRMLDVAARRAEVASLARARWRAWQELAQRLPPAEPLSALLDRHATAEEARRAHLAQPLVQEVAQRAVRGDALFPTRFAVEDPVAHFGDDTEDDYVDAVADFADFTFALLTTDGRWYDELTVRDDGERDLAAYRRLRATCLDKLADDAFRVSVLCHC